MGIHVLLGNLWVSSYSLAFGVLFGILLSQRSFRKEVDDSRVIGEISSVYGSLLEAKEIPSLYLTAVMQVTE